MHRYVITIGMSIVLFCQIAGAQTTRRSGTSADGSSKTSRSENTAEFRALRTAVEQLTGQIRALRSDMERQGASDTKSFNENATRLQIVLAELDRLRKSREEVRARLFSAQSHKADIETRLLNVPAETARSGQLINLDRATAEGYVRNALSMQLDQVSDELGVHSEDLEKLNTQIDVDEKLADTLRRRLKIDASQIDVVEEPEDSETLDIPKPDDASTDAPPPRV